MNKSGNDFPDKKDFISLSVPCGERTKYWSHSLHQREPTFLVVPWLKNLLDSSNLIVCLDPMLKFSGESIRELWFGLHFACLLNKALNLGILPVESGSPVKGVRL